MPAPRTVVVKYRTLYLDQLGLLCTAAIETHPSTSPSFFPLAANSLLSSTPAK